MLLSRSRQFLRATKPWPGSTLPGGRFPFRAFSKRPEDLRRFQEEIDLAKVAYLLCERSSADRSVEDILDLEVEEQRALVQRLCHKQVYALLDSMDQVYYKLRHPREDTSSRSFRGAEQSALDHHLEQVSEMVKESVGFTPELRKSGIEDEAAGDGLFVNGKSWIGVSRL